MRVLTVATAILCALTLPVVAQTRLPRTSPAERQVDEINRSITREQRSLQRDQQYQIDNNQMRQRIDRQQNLSNPSPPARLRNCPVGSIGC
ncbi:hypothetical protein [Microvirga antarctica]|uniref:hypothetical protein n=1 Tax=Microvirga antarctica TaxID=2819233 RepID=UPI001B306CB6|nr:hypothetical protein [Microvirga antarctica]